MNTTTVSVFGLGYVGCVSAACFAKEGHNVVGVDVSKAKVDMITILVRPSRMQLQSRHPRRLHLRRCHHSQKIHQRPSPE